MDNRQQEEQLDILHPQTSLLWEECCRLPEGIDDFRCILLHDKIYVGGRHFSSGNHAKLYVSSTELTSWSLLATPTYYFALTTYHSQLVLVGGIEVSSQQVTDQLLTSSNGKSWQPTLPPMPSKRVSCSAITTRSPECIVVAGGEKSDYIPSGIVEVLLEQQWSTVQALPRKFYDIKFTLHSTKIYLLGGFGQDHNMIYWCDVRALVATCKEARDKKSKPTPLWSRFSIPNKCSSLASYGQQLVAIGLIMGIDCTRILAHFPKNKIWVGVGDMPLELRNTVSLVLPEHVLVVMGVDEEAQKIAKRKVFKATLGVGSYHPDSQFSMNTLLKLDRVANIKVIQLLSEVKTKLITAAGITLESRAESKMSYLKDPELHVEIILSQWKLGRSQRPPTWRSLLDTLVELNMKQLSQDMLDFMCGKLKYLDAYRHVLATQECIDMWFVKILLLGAPRLGKTTACRRLSGLITDISSSQEQEQPSTGVIESKHSVIIRDLVNSTTALPPSQWTMAKDLNDEACMLLQFFYGQSYERMFTESATANVRKVVECTEREKEKVESAQPEKETAQAPVPVPPKRRSESKRSFARIFGKKRKDSLGVHLSCDSDEEGSSSDEVTTDDEIREEIPSIKNKVENVIETLEATTHTLDGTIQLSKERNSNTNTPKKQVINGKEEPSHRERSTSSSSAYENSCSDNQSESSAEVAGLFRKAIDSKHWKDIKHLLKDMTLLKMEDTGGQPEFMDMLPALTTGPALYLLFCKLIDDLQSHNTVTYISPAGGSTLPVKSTNTVEEVLLTTLASISCLNADSNTNYSTTPDATPNVKKGKKKSKAKQEDSMLDYVNKSVAYIIGTHKDLVSEDQIADFDEKLQNSIRSTDFFNEDLVQFSSAHRMILSVDNMHGGAEEIDKIRKFLESGMKRHFKKLSIPAAWLVLSLCLRKREKRTASLQSVLQLAGGLGITPIDARLALWFLHHCAGVLMHFPDVVELRDTVICDIQVVYDSVTNLVVNTFKFGSVSRKASERFRLTGQFSWEDIKQAAMSVSGDYVPLKKLVKLLEHLNIIAPIDEPTDSSGQVYFMPCVLQSASHDELDKWWGRSQHSLSPIPLFIRYYCGYTPIGVFPAMIANLVGQGALTLIDSDIKKNKVQFRYDEDTVTLVSHPKYYGVHVQRCYNAQTQTREVCNDLREMVEATLRTVTSQTNYGYSTRFQLSFECPSHPGREHLCSVGNECEVPDTMHCLEDRKKPEPHKMEDKHLVWFGKPFYLVRSDIKGCTSDQVRRSYVALAAPCFQATSFLGYGGSIAVLMVIIGALIMLLSLLPTLIFSS